LTIFARMLLCSPWVVKKMGNFLRQLLKFPTILPIIFSVVSAIRIAMSRESKNAYQEGHLFVAAIRLLEHKTKTPPDLNQISQLAGFSNEKAGLVSRRLEEAGIIGIVEGAYGNRWGIVDHLKLEELPRSTEVSQMDEALKQFKREKDEITRKVESIKEQQSKKQKDLFSEIEKKLKKDLAKK
jgi:hypothetical protein